MKDIFLSAILVFGLSAIAHEGPHGPEQKVAPHGGVLRDGTSLMFELVKTGENVKIYPLTHDGKPIDSKVIEVDLKKTQLADSRKKPIQHSLIAEGDSFVLKFEKGSSYRYSLSLVARYEGKENKANWQIELGSE
ncbi:MAG TPA: hypothetical protein PLJ21_01355 [Pseudobdellovibrionaceae bacterium]|nr:hypothetical protein [Pseudobdellovibrionaceae bacterium]